MSPTTQTVRGSWERPATYHLVVAWGPDEKGMAMAGLKVPVEEMFILRLSTLKVINPFVYNGGKGSQFTPEPCSVLSDTAIHTI